MFYNMPVKKVRSKERLDIDGVKDIIDICKPDMCVVELVGPSPKMGSAAAFGFGYSYAGLLGVIAGSGVKYDLITPQKWKVMFGLLGKPKDEARQMVIRAYPELKDHFKLKKHIDKAECLLIGLAWLKRNNDTDSKDL